MKKGLISVIVYYTAGLTLAGLSYLIVGHPYIHAPGLHHFIIILTFAGGLLWAVGATIRYLTAERTPKRKTIIVSNTLAVLVFVSFIGYEIISLENESDNAKTKPDEISMSINGDTTILYHNENPVYMKVADSVLFNMIDSARFLEIIDSMEIKLIDRR